MNLDKSQQLLTEIKTIIDLKERGLNSEINNWSELLEGASKHNIINLENLYTTSTNVKVAISQINEIVHASGIIKCLPKIITDKNESIISTSLASGAKGDGFDLVTNKRTAEFKFSEWKKSNGSRKRQVFADFTRLFIEANDSNKKELYVLSYEKVITFFNSKKAKWKNVLSKSGGLDMRFEKFLIENNIKGEHLYDVFSVSGVQIKNIEEFL